jgi:hypothetical protein
VSDEPHPPSQPDPEREQPDSAAEPDPADRRPARDPKPVEIPPHLLALLDQCPDPVIRQHLMDATLEQHQALADQADHFDQLADQRLATNPADNPDHTAFLALTAESLRAAARGDIPRAPELQNTAVRYLHQSLRNMLPKFPPAPRFRDFLPPKTDTPENPDTTGQPGSE